MVGQSDTIPNQWCMTYILEAHWRVVVSVNRMRVSGPPEIVGAFESGVRTRQS
jgi:hypothetical protein